MQSVKLRKNTDNVVLLTNAGVLNFGMIFKSGFSVVNLHIWKCFSVLTDIAKTIKTYLNQVPDIDISILRPTQYMSIFVVQTAVYSVITVLVTSVPAIYFTRTLIIWNCQTSRNTTKLPDNLGFVGFNVSTILQLCVVAIYANQH